MKLMLIIIFFIGFNITNLVIAPQANSQEESFEDFEDEEFDEGLSESSEIESDENMENNAGIETEVLENENNLSEEDSNIAIEKNIESEDQNFSEDLNLDSNNQPEISENIENSNSEELDLAVDEPDLLYEAKLYDIYTQYYNSPIPEDTWDVIVGDRKGEVYPIQPGDTLWGISQTFFADGFYWPKVWSLNGIITNPHQIEVGDKLYFYPGNDKEPPKMTLSKKNQSTSESQSNEVDSSDESYDEEDGSDEVKTENENKNLHLDDFDIPPPDRISRPVVKKFPPSFPEWQNDNLSGKYDEVGIDFGIRKNINAETSVILNGYIAENEPNSLGEVIETDMGGLAVSENQFLFIRSYKEKFEAGDQLLALGERRTLERANDFIAKADSYGMSIEIQGVISIIGEVSKLDKESTEGKLYRALVIKSLSPVSVGAKVLRQELTRVNILPNGPKSEVMAQIIGGIASDKRQTYATQSIAFLNKGSRDGLMEGQILDLRANREARYEKSILIENNRPVGKIKIAKVTPNFSTAVIISANAEIRAGDYTGQGELNNYLEMMSSRDFSVSSKIARKESKNTDTENNTQVDDSDSDENIDDNNDLDLDDEDLDI